jgi:hypothetical protein
MVTAEIKDVKIDVVRGSIVVETEYKVNGVVVQLGQTRYDENSGTNEEIIAKAKEDVAQHCENLIRRIEANQTFRSVESLKIQKALTEPIALAIKGDLIGYKTDRAEVVDVYKGVEIKVTADSVNSVKAVSEIKEV